MVGGRVFGRLPGLGGELKEPAKAEVKAWRPGSPVPREAMAVLWSRTDNQTWEGLVDLTGERVVSWTGGGAQEHGERCDHSHQR